MKSFMLTEQGGVFFLFVCLFCFFSFSFFHFSRQGIQSHCLCRCFVWLRSMVNRAGSPHSPSHAIEQQHSPSLQHTGGNIITISKKTSWNIMSGNFHQTDTNHPVNTLFSRITNTFKNWSPWVRNKRHNSVSCLFCSLITVTVPLNLWYI